MATAPHPRMSVEEYLEFDKGAELRNEYIRGEVFAMAGGSRLHGRLIARTIAALMDVEDRGCRVYASEVRLGIPNADFYTYPDVMVTCGDEKLRDEHSETVLNPVLIVEVLSDTTQSYDRGLKFEYYRRIASVRKYLTISQDKHLIEHWVRLPEGGWLLTEHTDGDIVLKIGVTLRVPEVYPSDVQVSPVLE